MANHCQCCEKLKEENAEEIKILTSCIKRLRAKVAEIPDLLEAEKYKERACNERDWEDLEEEKICDLERNVEELEEENEKLKERQSIMNATASVHIDDINQIHQDYGNMVRKLQDQLPENTQYWKDSNELLKAEIEKLKEENKKKKQVIKKLKEGEKQALAMCEFLESNGFVVCECDKWGLEDEFSSGICPECQGDYEDDEIDYYLDAGRKVVLKDGRVLTSKD